MSKTIWVCFREEAPKHTKQRIERICESITPDNVIPADPKIVVNRNVAYGVLNPKKSILYSGNSLLLGVISEGFNDWHVPLEDFPDGSYALFRDGKQNCEIVTDSTASRSIWYFKNNELFAASTSQVALIKFIGGFEFDDRVVPWMLSTGSLGPMHSWDRRIVKVSPNSSVLLNKVNWSLNVKVNKARFNTSNKSDEEFERGLMAALLSSFRGMNLNCSDWILPISGGYDSRGILCLLTSVGVGKLKTITWGLASSLEDPKNDAYVAKQLANRVNTPHKYYCTNLSDEPISKVVDRFITNGEGRIDHISGYLDGFKIWKTLHDEGVQGVVRGDEGFGWSIVSSSSSARLSVGLGLCSDYQNLEKFRNSGLFTQDLPAHLKKSNEESLEQWRDRLYHDFRLPSVLAALSDLKLSYVELINPLLFRSVLDQVREQPDHLRTEKSLFKKIVKSISPEIPFATRGANAAIDDVLKQKDFVELLKSEIHENFDKGLFPKDFLVEVLENIKMSEVEVFRAKTYSVRSILKRMLPSFMVRMVRKNVSSSPVLSYNQIAFRIYIISKMNCLLGGD